MPPLPLLKTFLLVSLLTLELMHSCESTELRALMALKSALDPSGRILYSWTVAGDPCGDEFVGIACNEQGKVVNISLQGMELNGSISSAVAELQWLSGFYLHYNKISGVIPREISQLNRVSEIYLNFNNLSGSVPAEFGKMISLQVLQLGYNELTGSIPTQLGSLRNLNVLALQSNHLSGAIPASLGDLSQLTRLDLSFNKLFGSIPTKIAQIPLLEVLDLRNNSLSGNVPSGLQRLNKRFQYGNNRDLCGIGYALLMACSSIGDSKKPDKPEPFGPYTTGIRPQQIPQSANLNSTCDGSNCLHSSKSNKGAVIAVIIALFIVASLSLLSVFAWYRRRKQRIGSSLELSDSRLSTDQSKDVYRKSVSPLIGIEYLNSWDPLSDGRSGVGFSQEVSKSFRFNLEEMESATQYFSEVNLLGKSNFHLTYKGILRDGSLVAIKSINKMSCKMDEAEFLAGLKMLTLLQHENIVPFRGFCCSRGRGECFLVYDFVTNGNLLDYLDVKDDSGRVLYWSTRLSIIKGIAKGIEYLHSNRPNKPSLIHQNLSAEKILIDKHFSPHLSDCGLNKLLADDVVFSTLKASAAMGYLAPEYATVGRLTEKSDVYAFGVLVFQIITGETDVSTLLLAAESGEIELAVEKFHCNYSRQEVAKLFGIATACISEMPSQRPTMEEVLQQLDISY